MGKKLHELPEAVILSILRIKEKEKLTLKAQYLVELLGDLKGIGCVPSEHKFHLHQLFGVALHRRFSISPTIWREKLRSSSKNSFTRESGRQRIQDGDYRGQTRKAVCLNLCSHFMSFLSQT